MRSRGSYKFNVLLTVSLRENVGSALRTKISKKSQLCKSTVRDFPFVFCLIFDPDLSNPVMSWRLVRGVHLA